MPLDIAEASDAPCGHDKRFGGVFFAPKGTGGCVACAYEQAAAERDALAARLAEAERVLRLAENTCSPWCAEQIYAFLHSVPAASDSAAACPDCNGTGIIRDTDTNMGGPCPCGAGSTVDEAPRG